MSAIPTTAAAAPRTAQASLRETTNADGEDFGTVLAKTNSAETKPSDIAKTTTTASSAQDTKASAATDTKSSTKSAKSSATDSKIKSSDSKSGSQVAANAPLPPQIAALQKALADSLSGAAAANDDSDDAASTEAIGAGSAGHGKTPGEIDTDAPSNAASPDGDDAKDSDGAARAATETAASKLPQASGAGDDKLKALMEAAQQHRAPTSQSTDTQSTDTSQSNADPTKQANAQTQQGHDDGSRNSQGHGDQSAASQSNTASTQQPATSAYSSAGTQPAWQTATNTSTIGMPATVGTQATSSTTAPVLHVAPTVQDTAAQPDLNALAIGIAAKSLAGAKQFDISLDPPELGRVDVKLTVDATGKAQAHLAADKPETLQMLERDSGTLERALKDSGVQLANNGLQFSLKGNGNQGNSAQSGTGRSQQLSVSASASPEAAGAIQSTYGLAFSRAGVDIRV